MPSKNPAQRLRDIVENIDAIAAFTARMTLEEFVRDRKTVYAVTRALEIISKRRAACRMISRRIIPQSIGQRWPRQATCIAMNTRWSTMGWSGIPSNTDWQACVLYRT